MFCCFNKYITALVFCSSFYSSVFLVTTYIILALEHVSFPYFQSCCAAKVHLELNGGLARRVRVILVRLARDLSSRARHFLQQASLGGAHGADDTAEHALIDGRHLEQPRARLRVSCHTLGRRARHEHGDDEGHGGGGALPVDGADVEAQAVRDERARVLGVIGLHVGDKGDEPRHEIPSNGDVGG